VKLFYIHFTLLELYSRGDLALCQQRDLLETVCLRPRGGKLIVQPRSERFDQTVRYSFAHVSHVCINRLSTPTYSYWMEFLPIINCPQGVYCYCSIGFVLLSTGFAGCPKATIVIFHRRRSARFGRGIKNVRFHVRSLHDHVCLFARENFLPIFGCF
jgi:hypothetical protein